MTTRADFGQTQPFNRLIEVGTESERGEVGRQLHTFNRLLGGQTHESPGTQATQCKHALYTQ